MRGEEGFWLFSDPPSARIEADYGVTLSDPFLTHLQRGAVRLNVGGSGSFVSPDGLVMTNYHCVFDVVSYYDASGNDYLQNGFYAPTMEEEIPCVGMPATVLIDWEDVTDQIVSGTDRETEEGWAEQRKRISELETSEKERTGLNCRVESFFEGYFLYRYRIFDDLRLVFAPERTIGLFGGDADNFEYPRYNFDVAFLRVYQDGTPYHPTDYFRWSPNGAVPGELLFVSGNPGHSERFKTAADLELVRDSLPFTIHRLESQEASFQRKIQEGEEQGENTARLQKHLVYCQNGIKMWKGRLLALENPSILARKREEERELF